MENNLSKNSVQVQNGMPNGEYIDPISRRKFLKKIFAALAMTGCSNRNSKTVYPHPRLIIPEENDRPIIRMDVPIPSGLERVPITNITIQWMEEQKRIARATISGNGGLQNASTFLVPETKKILDQYVDKKLTTNGNTVQFVKLEPPQCGYHYAFKVNRNGKRELWYVSQEPRYPDQFPEVTDRTVGPRQAQLAIWGSNEDGTVNKLTQSSFPIQNVFDVSNKTIHNGILEEIQLANTFRNLEHEDPAGAHEFDLPKNEPIGIIIMVGERGSEDPITAGSISFLNHFPAMMNHLGYTFVKPIGKPGVTMINSDPQKVLDEQLKFYNDCGIKHCLIIPEGHGDYLGVYFNTKEGDKRLSGAQLLESLQSVPIMQAFTMIAACKTGGIFEALQLVNIQKGNNTNLDFVMECTPIGITQEGRAEGNEKVPKVISTYYRIFLVYYLLKGLPFGQAHLNADLVAKQLAPNDPAFIRLSPDGKVLRTSFYSIIENRGMV